MLVLRSSTTSPFARKIRIAISILVLRTRFGSRMPTRSIPRTACGSKTRSAKFRRSYSTTAARCFDSRGDPRISRPPRRRRPYSPRPRARRVSRRCACKPSPTAFLDAGILRVYEGRFRPEEKTRGEMARPSNRQDGPRPRGARKGAAHARVETQRRRYHACLRARLSRLPLRNELARDVPQAREVADAFANKVPAFADTVPH